MSQLLVARRHASPTSAALGFFLTALVAYVVCAISSGEQSTEECTATSYSYEQLTELTTLEAVDLLCSGAVTAVDYASALLQRAEELDCLNAYAALNSTKVLAQAANIDAKAAAGEDVHPLCGLSFLVKDNLDVAGYETVAGTRGLEGFVLETSSPLISQLQRAHGIVLGKTRMHELAEGVTSISPVYGPVLNPHSVNVHVGGSSGGTAALIAARGASAGFCTDTGGSCRIPASLTGVVGYRPTASSPQRQQCYNAGSGIVPMTTSRDTVGLMARTVADIQFLDAIFNACPSREPERPTLNGLRVGYPTNWWLDLGEEVVPAFTAALEAMTAAGVELVEFDVGLMLAEQQLNAPDYFTYIFEMPRELSRYLFQHRYNLSLPELIDQIGSPLVKESLESWAYRDLDSWPSPQEYLHMLGTVTPKITQLWNDYFDNLLFDIIIVPTTPLTARPIDAAEPYSSFNGRLEPTLSVYTRTAEIDCPSAVPGLSLPIGLAADRLPIGIQLHSRPGDDRTLLAVGRALEDVFANVPPPPRQPSCSGCKAVLNVREPDTDQDWERVDSDEAARMRSIYSMKFVGHCESLRSENAQS